MKDSIFPKVWEGIKIYFLSIGKIFSKDFISQRWHLHMGCSFAISILITWFLREFAYLGDTPIGFHLFIGGFSLFCINFVREWYYGMKFNAPFDIMDCVMGSYGGILGSAIVSLLLY